MAQLFTIQENEGENGKEEENAAAAKTLTWRERKLNVSLFYTILSAGVAFSYFLHYGKSDYHEKIIAETLSFFFPLYSNLFLLGGLIVDWNRRGVNFPVPHAHVVFIR